MAKRRKPKIVGTHPVRKVALAKADVLEIWLYIGAGSERAPDQQADRFEAALERLALFPRGGPERADLPGTGIRMFPVGKYVILYRVVADAVEILRVVHGARDIPCLFRAKELGFEFYRDDV